LELELKPSLRPDPFLELELEPSSRTGNETKTRFFEKMKLRKNGLELGVN
jgi:hypothetical protein